MLHVKYGKGNCHITGLMIYVNNEPMFTVRGWFFNTHLDNNEAAKVRDEMFESIS